MNSSHNSRIEPAEILSNASPDGKNVPQLDSLANKVVSKTNTVTNVPVFRIEELKQSLVNNSSIAKAGGSTKSNTNSNFSPGNESDKKVYSRTLQSLQMVSFGIMTRSISDSRLEKI